MNRTGCEEGTMQSPQEGSQRWNKQTRRRWRAWAAECAAEAATAAPSLSIAQVPWTADRGQSCAILPSQHSHASSNVVSRGRQLSLVFALAPIGLPPHSHQQRPPPELHCNGVCAFFFVFLFARARYDCARQHKEGQASLGQDGRSHRHPGTELRIWWPALVSL